MKARPHLFFVPLTILIASIAISSCASHIPEPHDDPVTTPAPVESALLPDPVPVGYRYEYIERHPWAVEATRDTFDFVFFKRLDGIVGGYAPLDHTYEESPKSIATGTAWIMLDSRGGDELWMESEVGFHWDQFLFHFHVMDDTLALGVKVPRHPVIGEEWVSGFSDTSEVISLENVVWQEKVYPGIEIVTWTSGSFGGQESTRRRYAIGVGLIEGKGNSIMDLMGELRLLEVIPTGREDLVETINFANISFLEYPLASFSRYTGLKRLIAGNDSLTNEMLPQLAVFKHLEVLSLSGADINGETFQDLRFRSLRNLDLSSTMVQDAYIGDIPNLEKLQVLDLRQTPVTDAGVGHLVSARNLRQLHVGGSSGARRIGLDPIRSGATFGSISDLSCLVIAELKNLEVLDLSNTYITDEGLGYLKELTQLRELCIANTRITDQGLATLTGMKNLEVLNLGNTLITDAGMVYLKSLSMLRELDLSLTTIGVAGLEHLAGHAQLIKLNLNSTRVTDECATVLMEMPRLVEVNAFYTGMTSRTKKITEDHPALKLLLIAPEPNPLFDLMAGIPAPRMINQEGSPADPGTLVDISGDSSGSTSGSTSSSSSSFSILPDSYPLAHLFEVQSLRDGKVSAVETNATLFLKKVVDVQVQPTWPLHPDTVHVEPQSEMGSGWQLLDCFGNVSYWIETPTGLYSASSTGEEDRSPAFGSLMVASRPDTNMHWALYYDAHVTIKDTSEVEALGRIWPGQLTSMDHRGEGAERQWAIGLGLVMEKYTDPVRGGLYKRVLVDTLAHGEESLIDKLILRDLRVDNEGLASFAAYTGLETLALTATRIDDEGLQHLKAFPRLRVLDLADTELNGTGFKADINLTALEDLNVSGTRLNDSTVQFLPNLDRLRRLNLRCTYITDNALKDLAGAYNLEALFLGNCTGEFGDVPYQSFVRYFSNRASSTRTYITGRGFHHLANLSGLKMLDLSGTDISDDFMAELSVLPALIELDISNTMITDSGVAALPEMLKLRRLNLNGTAISDSSLVLLSEMSGLEGLSIRETGITVKGLAHLAGIRSLRFLDLRDTGLDEECVEILLKMCQLEQLSLPFGTWVSRVREGLPNTQVWPRWP